jgi:hypothetical protein
MSRLLAALAFTSVLNASALAQMTITPGPGGVPIAPGLPVPGYTPGGVGPGGVEIAPGPAARGIPMNRIGPGGVELPPRPDPHPDSADIGREPDLPTIMPGSLTLTIHSRDMGSGQPSPPDSKIDTIEGLFAALRTCWEPPAPEQAVEGVQMTVRFSFKRNGELVAAPFVTYTTPGTEAAARGVYRNAITASLERCAPLPFSETFGAAIVGRPLSIRYIDDRVAAASSQRRD